MTSRKSYVFWATQPPSHLNSKLCFLWIRGHCFAPSSRIHFSKPLRGLHRHLAAVRPSRTLLRPPGVPRAMGAERRSFSFLRHLRAAALPFVTCAPQRFPLSLFMITQITECSAACHCSSGCQCYFRLCCQCHDHHHCHDHHCRLNTPHKMSMEECR